MEWNQVNEIKFSYSSPLCLPCYWVFGESSSDESLLCEECCAEIEKCNEANVIHISFMFVWFSFLLSEAWWGMKRLTRMESESLERVCVRGLLIRNFTLSSIKVGRAIMTDRFTPTSLREGSQHPRQTLFKLLPNFNCLCCRLIDIKFPFAAESQKQFRVHTDSIFHLTKFKRSSEWFIDVNKHFVLIRSPTGRGESKAKTFPREFIGFPFAFQNLC